MKIKSFITLLLILSFLVSPVYAEVRWIDKNQSGLLGSETKPVRKAYIGSLTPLVLEGAVTNDYQTTVTVTEPTADRTLTIPDSSGTIMLIGDVGAATGVWFAADSILFEGATDNANEATLTILTDPAADVTIKIPTLTTGNLLLSTLVTNDVDVANSIWAVSNGIMFEGATINTSEIKLTAADATADAVFILPDAAAATYSLMSSTLATNAVDIANSVTGGTNQLIFEGTANEFETIITATDATADTTVTIANGATGSIMVSTLATNAPDIANSVTGGTNQLLFEGSAADNFETIITATNPTADTTVTIADGATGSVMVSSLATNAPDIANSAWGISEGIRFEGSAADVHEIDLVSANATADVIYTLPDAATGTYGIVTSSLATNAIDAANSITGGTNQIIMEGATADAYETIITPTDATIADRTITLPNYSGSVPLIVSQSSTQSSANNTTTDVTGSSISLGPEFVAGSTLKWTVAGTITGANAAKNVILYIDDAAIITLATQAATAGDYEATCTMAENTALANQKAYCKMVVAAGSDIEFDYAADTTNFATAKTVKMQIVSANAGDTITTEHAVIEYFNK